ncbi:MAG: hypothetical protein ACRDT4_20320 [Micromonosporaceae bacterium]
MSTAIGYAYPWDFDDPAAADRAVALGVDAVAVAASYHSTRAATPLHPTRRTLVAPHAAFYLPVREAAWRGARLTPAAPSWPGSFGQSRDAVRAAGLGVHAWIVLTHNTRLGTANPDLTVRNAFGESYEYALCPANEEVADYCATLVAETLELGEPDGVILEACGPLGVDHGGHHDKLEFAAWTATQRALLSLCFCPACQTHYRTAHLNPAHLAATVRTHLTQPRPTWVAEERSTRRPERRVDHPSTSQVRADPGVDAVLGEFAGVVRGVRVGVVRGLRERVVAQVRAIRPDARIALHASVDPYATGPFASVAGGVPEAVDAVVATCWSPGGEARLAALRDAVLVPQSPPGAAPGARRGTAIGGYVRPDTLPADDDDLAELVRRYLAAGLTELHLYHLGLLPEPALRQLANLVTTTRHLAADTAPATPTTPPGTTEPTLA